MNIFVPQAVAVRGYGGTLRGLLGPPLHSGISAVRSAAAPYLEVEEVEEEEEEKEEGGREKEEEKEGREGEVEGGEQGVWLIS